jgi:hypothetical protein
MDPYLEQHWRDVHHNLITFVQGMINRELPPDLRARVEERVFVESLEGSGRSIYPDVRVVEKGWPRGSTNGQNGKTGVATAEPLVIEMPEEEVSEGFIEVIDVGSGNKVVTVIEILSLSNKTPGPGQDLYRQKQHELRQGEVSLVEIDLLRAGERVLVVPSGSIPPSHRTPYQVCIRRGWDPTHPGIIRVPLREPLPTIGVPLRETDAPATLNLQALIEQCYVNARYDDLDYRGDPQPPLDPDDAAWADVLLRSAGKR